MNKQYIRNTSTLLGAVLILLISSAPAQAQLPTQAQTPAPGPDYSIITGPGVYNIENASKVVALEVVDPTKKGAAHLEKGQLILMIGPTGLDERYHLRPQNLPGRPLHVWKIQNHPANKIGAADSRYYLVNVAVKDHDPAECADHQMVMFIEDEDADGPTEIEIWGSDCSDTGLDHGGTAHAER